MSFYGESQLIVNCDLFVWLLFCFVCFFFLGSGGMIDSITEVTHWLDFK